MQMLSPLLTQLGSGEARVSVQSLGSRARRPQAPEDVGLGQPNVILGEMQEVVTQWAVGKQGLDSDSLEPGND